MAVEYMKPVNIKIYQGNINTPNGFEYKGVALSSAGNGPSVIIPTQIRTVSVRLLVSGSSSGNVQYSLSTLAEVLADTAIWQEWDSGVVTAHTTDTANPVTAIRQVNVSGTTQLELRAQ